MSGARPRSPKVPKELLDLAAQKASTPLGALLRTYLKRPAPGPLPERHARPPQGGARRPPLAPVNGRVPPPQPVAEPEGLSYDEASSCYSVCETEYEEPPPSVESFSPRTAVYLQ